MREDTDRPPRVSERLAAADALSLMASAPVGHVVFTLDALPAILPVHFCFDAGALVFRLVADQKVHAALHDCVCAFEADAYDPDDCTGWTVTVTGRVLRVDHPADIARLAELLPRTWAWGHDHRFFRVTPEMIDGRLLRAANAGPAAA